jgi:hypothetical protein
VAQAIVDLIVDAYVDYLSDKCRNDLDTDDPTRFGIVRGGHLQEDPIPDVSYLLIHSNDSSDGWRHMGTNAETSTPYGMRSMFGHLSALPQFEIGGKSMLWWRRLHIEAGAFFLNLGYDRDVSRQHSNVMFSRTEYWLMKANIDDDAGVLGLVDDFGERVMEVLLHSSKYTEGGGPPEDFIWRARIWFDVLTERSFD